jgi:hypothetical protein
VQATGEQAEKFFHVAPGADASRIRVDVDGVGTLAGNDRGELVASTGIGSVLLSAPLAWQEIDGARHDVPVRYALLGASRYGFALGAHDAQHEVVIDPIVQSTYIGGDKFDQINALTVHPTTGDIYVTGTVESTSLFPVSAGAVDSTRAGFTDAFVARLPADLKSFTEVTYFGGAGNEQGSDIKVNPVNGDVYVLGASLSATLPGTAGAAQAAGSTNGTPFVARFTPDLQTNVRTTLYGGGFLAQGGSQLLTPGLSLTISPTSGTLYVASTGHATTIPNAAGGAITTPSEYFGFITTIAPDLASFGQATYLSGSDASSQTFLTAMTLDPVNDDIVVVAQTNSAAMPTTPGAAQPTNPGAGDQDQAAVIARFSSDLKSVKALTYYVDVFGHLFPYAVTLGGGATTIGGTVNSGTTPLQGMAGGAIPTPSVALNDFTNGFVVKLSNDLTTIIQGTYVRGDDTAILFQLIYDAASNSYFATGQDTTHGLRGFPALDAGTDPLQKPTYVTRIAPDLKSFIHSTLLTTTNGANSIARHPLNGDLYIAGPGSKAPNTASGAQPTDQAANGVLNGVITRLTVDLSSAPSAGQIAFGAGAYQTTAGTAGNVVVTRSNGSAGAVSVNVTTTDGTATAPADYSTVTTSVTFADGDTASKAVAIATTARSSTQGNKTVNVTLSAVTGGATLGGQSTAVLTIGDASVAPPPPPPPPPPPVSSDPGDRLPDGGGCMIASPGAQATLDPTLPLLVIAAWGIFLLRKRRHATGSAAPKVVALIIASVAAGATSAADATGWYLEAVAGTARFSNNEGFGPLAAPDSSVRVDKKSDTDWRLSGGYRVLPNLAIEGGYLDAGRFGFTDTLAGGTPVDLAVRGRVRSLYAAAVGVLPLGGPWSAFARLGVAGSRVSLSASDGESGSKRSLRPLLGLGARFAVDEHWYAGAGFDYLETGRFGAAPGFTQSLSTGHIDQWTVSAGYSF